MPEDVRRIIRLIGYRPRPGIGATGLVAALTRTPRPFVIPRGFAIEGRAAAGEPQIFELDEDIPIGTLGRRLPASARFGTALPTAAGTAPTPKDARGYFIDSVPAHEQVDPNLPQVTSGGPAKFYLAGVVSGLKPGDMLVAIRKDWDGVPYANAKPSDVLSIDPGPPRIFDNPTDNGPVQFSILKLNALTPIFDGKGRPTTQLDLLGAHNIDPHALRADYRLMRPTKLAHLWLYHVRYPPTDDPASLLAAGLNNAIDTAEKFLTNPIGALFGGGGPPPPPPQDPRVLTNTVSSDPGPAHGAAHLEAITRGIKPGDPVLFEQQKAPDDGSGAPPNQLGLMGLPGLPGGAGIAGFFQQVESVAASAVDGLFPKTGPDQQALANSRAQVAQLVKVTGYTEEIWYANAPQAGQTGHGPPVGPPGQSGGGGGLLSNVTGGLFGGGGGGTPEAPIPIPHSKITFAPNPFIGAMANAGNAALPTIVVHYAFQEVGELVPPPPGPITVVDVPPDTSFTKAAVIPTIVESRTGTSGTTGVVGTTGIAVTGEPLVAPLRALLNLLPISRGETVLSEILGSGDPTVAGQEFVLRRAPLTYLPDTGPGSTNGYRSTLRVRVDGIEWTEVPSFYAQKPDARVFVTREDEQQQTHVRFGDGENGARLPAGTDNVVARYRVGSGAAVPPAGTLTSILEPLPGLQGIRNPVAVGGGADPDPPEQIRRYAPRSVLTFGRAISGDDYETVAAQTPGVRRARAYWSWDAVAQRRTVKVFVGDDDAAVVAATTALRAFADPNRPVLVALAGSIYPDLTLTVEVDPAFDPDAVAAAVGAALQDPLRQPFGAEVVQHRPDRLQQPHLRRLPGRPGRDRRAGPAVSNRTARPGPHRRRLLADVGRARGTAHAGRRRFLPSAGGAAAHHRGGGAPWRLARTATAISTSRTTRQSSGSCCRPSTAPPTATRPTNVGLWRSWSRASGPRRRSSGAASTGCGRTSRSRPATTG